MPSITVRLTDADNARITDAVTRSGMTRSEWVRAALLGEVHRAGQTQLPPQTAGAKSGAGGIVRGQVVPAEDRSPGPEPAPCRHPRFRRIGGVCSRCGERVKK